MIRIMKASAGSGKTFNLAKTYIRLLLESGDTEKFRHILAVTFTNKATEEMKSRILRELFVLSDNPVASPYTRDFVPRVFPSEEALRDAARGHLMAILHDYSAFAVSTIDRFFQQTLRAFAREAGRFSSYQVTLDRDALIGEAVDRILDSMTEMDDALLRWLTDSVAEDLAAGKRFNLDDRLAEMAGSLKSEAFTSLSRRRGLDPLEAYSRENLNRIRLISKAVIEDFRLSLKAATEAVLGAFAAAGVEPEQTKSSFAVKIRKYADWPEDEKLKAPTPAFMDSLADSEKWFKKADQHLRPRLESTLPGPAGEFIRLFDQPFRTYQTAILVRNQIYSLGIAGDLEREFAALQTEKNLMTLDESTSLLRDIIDGTDAPFIYEKTGVRYENFLLDEFQDTSGVQWNNFKPLLIESQANSSDTQPNGGENLLVGDVKQSIYRWRGSDWRLLDSVAPAEFGVKPSDEEILEGNWRSLPEIVSFNNELFAWASSCLDSLLLEKTGLDGGIAGIYSSASQKVCTRDKAPGCVEARFCEDDEEEMAEVLGTVASIREAGAEWSDIAILVRNNKEGSLIAESLIDNGIPVISDDSLYVKSSITVRRLVSQLSLVSGTSGKEGSAVAGFLASSMAVETPEGYHSLYELSEMILRSLKEYDPDLFEAEVPYIIAFQDFLSEWSARNGNDLALFLREWDSADPHISPPEGVSAVRVMTIHKSKGLEFPAVIIPYLEKLSFSSSRGSMWCVPETGGTSLEGISDVAYRVGLSSDTVNTLFSQDYLRELRLQYVDSINILYVAFTRAEKYLKIIGKTPGKTVSDMSGLLSAYVSDGHGFTEQDGVMRKGVPYDFTTLKRRRASSSLITGSWTSIAPGDRLRSRSDASDFFGGEGTVGFAASARLRGKVLHDILSMVEKPSDLPSAVEMAVTRGELPEEEMAAVLAFLSEKIASRPEWFPESSCKVLREVSLFDGRGGVRRPDRVLVADDGTVTVIDYKFGEREAAYDRQVAEYVRILRAMGYSSVSGHLWYLSEK
ncbi:MAG: UvrD-helicase domain-containing protein [Bacteroidales bacterium]|nr:UvrD-helicase domain-containing protein [Bacteroidales bacterium]